MGHTTKEAASILGVESRQVVKLLNQGKLSAKRHGNAWNISPASVEAYKNAPRRPGPAKGQGGRPRKDRV